MSPFVASLWASEDPSWVVASILVENYLKLPSVARFVLTRLALQWIPPGKRQPGYYPVDKYYFSRQLDE